MAISEQSLPLTQQENLLALLAHSDEHGKIVAQILEGEDFEGDYKVIAERVLEYWGKYGVAPKLHTADLFPDILEDEKNRRATVYKRIFSSMYQLNEEGINAKYVIDNATRLKRVQQMKRSIFQAGEILVSGRDPSVEETEEVLHKLLQARDYKFKPGMRLDQVDRILTYLEEQYSEFVCGVSVLDRSHIVPARGKTMVFIAPSGLGKTWFLTNVGKHALLNQKKVLHLSGEIDEEDLGQRYWQSLFAVPKRGNDDDKKTPRLKYNRDGDMIGIDFDSIDPEFTFGSEDIREELMARLSIFGDRWYSKMVLKRFPRAWKPNDVRSYLDSLEATEGFIPDIILFDSPYHLSSSESHKRESLIHNFEQVVAIGEERNVAMVATHQTSKEGAAATMSRAKHMAEAWAIVWAAHFILTYSSTDTEHALGLARLYVDKARTEKDKWGALITQNYSIGQFCLSSTRLRQKYFSILDEIEDDREDSNDGSRREKKRSFADNEEDE